VHLLSVCQLKSCCWQTMSFQSRSVCRKHRIAGTTQISSTSMLCLFNSELIPNSMLLWKKANRSCLYYILKCSHSKINAFQWNLTLVLTNASNSYLELLWIFWITYENLHVQGFTASTVLVLIQSQVYTWWTILSLDQWASLITSAWNYTQMSAVDNLLCCCWQTISFQSHVENTETTGMTQISSTSILCLFNSDQNWFPILCYFEKKENRSCLYTEVFSLKR